VKTWESRQYKTRTERYRTFTVLPNVCLQHKTSTLFTTQLVALTNFDYPSLINRKLVKKLDVSNCHISFKHEVTFKTVHTAQLIILIIKNQQTALTKHTCHIYIRYSLLQASTVDRHHQIKPKSILFKTKTSNYLKYVKII
jgi:hypothetical protein